MEERYRIYIQQRVYNKGGEMVNEYHFMTDTGIYLGVIRFPPNQQYAFDSRAIEIICKALSMRWCLIKGKK